MKPAGLILADSSQRVDGQKCSETSHCRGERAKDPKFCAIVAILCVERVPHETAVAGAMAEQADLSLELDGGCRDQRNAQSDRGIADGQARGKIVAAINDEVVTFKEPRGILNANMLLDWSGFHEMVETVYELECKVRLGIAGVSLSKKQLAMEVAEIDDIRIDDRYSADAGACKGWNDRAADAPCADHANVGRLELALACSADLRKDNMPRVPLELGVAEVHWPVDPKPPLPRLVSLKVSTSLK